MENYIFTISDENIALAGQSTVALINTLSTVPGIHETERHKADEDTQDLGTIVTVVATSGAALALAKGVAAWLKSRRNASIEITMAGPNESISAIVRGIDPEVALRITEVIIEKDNSKV